MAKNFSILTASAHVTRCSKKTWILLGLLFCFLMRMPFGPFFLRRFHLRLRVYIICFIFSAFSINTDHENKNRFSSSKCFRFFLATPLCAHLQTEVSAKFILFPWIFLCCVQFSGRSISRRRGLHMAKQAATHRWGHQGRRWRTSPDWILSQQQIMILLLRHLHHHIRKQKGRFSSPPSLFIRCLRPGGFRWCLAMNDVSVHINTVPQYVVKGTGERERGRRKGAKLN